MDSKQNEIIFLKVKDFIVPRLGISANDVRMDSMVETDFGLGGLDTISFYNDFFEAFKIRNIDDFNYDNHVTPDRINHRLIFKSLFSRKSKLKSNYQDISVKHLINVIQIGTWVEP